MKDKIEDLSQGQIVKDDFVAMVQSAKKNSCVEEKVPVKGEFYVSKNKLKNSKIKLGINHVVYTLSVAGVLASAAALGGTMDMDHAIKSEVNKTVTRQDVIGGGYEEENVYDEGFVNYVNGLNMFESNHLYNYAEKELEGDKTLSEVVDEMEDNYLSDQEKRR